jgi:hypothetical protein
MIDRAGMFQALGVSAVAAGIEASSRAEWCDQAAWFGAEVIAKL